MQYRTLGRTGITVSHLCLGAMMFGVSIRQNTLFRMTMSATCASAQ